MCHCWLLSSIGMFQSVPKLFAPELSTTRALAGQDTCEGTCIVYSSCTTPSNTKPNTTPGTVSCHCFVPSSSSTSGSVPQLCCLIQGVLVSTEALVSMPDSRHFSCCLMQGVLAGSPAEGPTATALLPAQQSNASAGIESAAGATPAGMQFQKRTCLGVKCLDSKGIKAEGRWGVGDGRGTQEGGGVWQGAADPLHTEYFVILRGEVESDLYHTYCYMRDQG